MCEEQQAGVDALLERLESIGAAQVLDLALLPSNAHRLLIHSDTWHVCAGAPAAAEPSDLW